MKSLCALFRTVCAILAASILVPAVAQPGVSSEANRRPVYIFGIRQQGTTSSYGDLSSFTNELLKLRLAALKSFQAKSADASPNCEAELIGPPRLQTSLVNLADFYMIQASIEVRSPDRGETEVVLEYELAKSVRCERVSLLVSKEQFAGSEILKYLNSMADVIALLLEKERKVTKALVRITTASDQRTSRFAADLDQVIGNELKKAGDFDLLGASDPQADYAINGEVLLNKRLSYRITIATKDGRKYPSRVVEGPASNNLSREALAAYFTDVAYTIVDYLRYIRYIPEARHNIPLTDEQATNMLERARRLMCVGVTSGNCKQQPETAILLLSELQERKRLTDLELLGKAQLLVGDYQNAAESFDNARGQVANTDPEAQIKLLNQSGEAWFKANNYEKAINRYETSLTQYALFHASLTPALLSSEPEIYLQRVRSYRLGNRGLDELRHLLKEWPTRGSNELIEELGYLIKDLSQSNIADAEKLLEEYQGTPQYEIAKLSLQREQTIRSFQQAVQRNPFSGFAYGFGSPTAWASPEELDQSLKAVEALPVESLPPDIRLLRQTYRGAWYIVKKDFAKGLPLLEAAAQNDETGTSQIFLAQSYYLKAQQPGSVDPEVFYKKTSELLANLIRTTTVGPETYDMLVITNHKLGKDKETRELLQSLTKDNKDDIYALRALNEVCTHYLDDLECGLHSVEVIRSHNLGTAWKNVTLGLLAEVRVLRGEYAVAYNETNDVTGKPFDHPRNLFYRTWVLFAVGRDSEAYAVAKEWKTMMDNHRRTGMLDIVLDGARRALDKETVLTAAQKDLLRAMLSAMADKSKPLPSSL
jgi:hypothetical protein